MMNENGGGEHLTPPHLTPLPLSNAERVNRFQHPGVNWKMAARAAAILKLVEGIIADKQ